MTQIDRRLTPGAPGEKRRVLQARCLFRDLAGRVPDRDRARRIEARLNDAWLCLRLAQVAEDPALEESRRRAYASLLAEALRAAGPLSGR